LILSKTAQAYCDERTMQVTWSCIFCIPSNAKEARLSSLI
jgi:hypothetical protein